ncbi:hypothetical protein chiPu_0029923, partial [Chiloscyllium punctatum]|nr:hypothetical protein [Chiloscyllium punctatum]
MLNSTPRPPRFFLFCAADLEIIALMTPTSSHQRQLSRTAHDGIDLRNARRADAALGPVRRHRFLFAILRRAPEFPHRRPVRQPGVAQEAENFVRPDPTPHLRVPAHGVTKPGVAMQQHAQQGLGSALQHHLGKFEPEQHPPRRHVSGREHLMLVVPSAAIGLDHTSFCRETEIGRPAMRRDVEHLDLIGIVGQKLPQAAPVIAIGLLLETDHPGRHRQDAVPAHQADSLAIGRGGGALANQLQ